jgi:hypothetical protein
MHGVDTEVEIVQSSCRPTFALSGARAPMIIAAGGLPVARPLE